MTLGQSQKRVLDLLLDGWQTNHDLIEKAHATEALRRLRELREKGIPIEKRRVERDGRVSNTYEYRVQPGQGRLF